MLNNIFRKRKRPFLGRVNHHKDANGSLFDKKKKVICFKKGTKRKKRAKRGGKRIIFVW
jgi:hypothetical protein